MDLDFGQKLREEAEYVLGWVIDRAKKYYDLDLTRSPHVISSTERYFADADILEQWLEDNCVIDASAVTAVAVLFENFDFWADEARIRAKPDKGRFSQRLKAKGFALERKTLVKGGSPVRVVVGLYLRQQEMSIECDY